MPAAATRRRAAYPPGLAEQPALAGPVAAPTAVGRRWRHFINVAGVFSAALGLEAFILPNGLFDGGVTGISLLAHQPRLVSLFLVVFNLPFIWLGYRQMGRGFAVRALAAILGLALVFSVQMAPYSILTYLAAAKTIAFVVDGIEEYTGVTIISAHGDAIRRALTERRGRGVPGYAGQRGYGSRGEQPEAIDIVLRSLPV